MATNYNSSATKACADCCRYDKPKVPPVFESYTPQSYNYGQTAQYPYDINPENASCIRDTPLNDTWVVTEGSTTYYGEGYRKYKEKLEQVVYGSNPSTVPNWDSNGSMSQIWAAFDRLLINKPNSRVFINNLLFTPWIIPLYSTVTPLTDNPNKQKFINDCNTVGGEMYIYQEGGSTTLISLNYELTTTQKKYNEVQQEYNDYRENINGEPTPEQQAEIVRLRKELKFISKIIGGLKENIKATSSSDNIGNNSYVRDHFMACLCNDSDIVEPVLCKTTSIKGDTLTISPTRAECVNNYELFFRFLDTQINIGYPSGIYSISELANNINSPRPPYSIAQKSFFNVFVLTEMRISQDDAEFVMENFLNYTPAYYPYNSTTLDTLNGSSRSREIIKNAFLNGANLWLPLSHDLSTDIITNKECCDLVNGIYKPGGYPIGAIAYGGQPYSLYSEGNGNTTNIPTGICLCNEIKQPCPTFSDGTVEPITKVIETRTGSITTTYVNVSEECCSNASLQSKMPGNWTWDGTRCVLVNEENSNACDESTIITISETPISIRGVECIDNTVTITAYIYFEEPNNKCTDGTLVGNDTPLTNDIIELYRNPPSNAEEIARYSKEKNWTKDGNLSTQIPKDLNPDTPGQKTNCCYDTSEPIEGLLIIQDENHVKIDSPVITYVDTFSSTQTTINTNVNVGTGFDRWVKLTTVVDVSNINSSQPFNVAVEFTQGLFKCCDYNIYFDDIEVGCLQAGVREIYNVEQCPGFELRHVIDNKKSWVYNPGTNTMSDSVEDNIIRGNGTLGMNIAQSNPNIIDGGHGAINRVFAPSVDAELPFRDTDYYGLHGVIEKHSKLVLNSKEVILQFNMCPDGDCVLGKYGYLTDDDGTYILDDDGGRIIIQDEIVPFPNLLELETFKKTFQGFWVQFMEQFIPATTIFVSGEKWCNSRICSEMLVSDYFLDIENDSGIISPTPTTETTPEEPNTIEPNIRQQSVPNTGVLGEIGSTPTDGETGTTNTDELGPIIVGDVAIYSIEALDPERATRVIRRKLRRANTQ
jgi:hypothetical protein